MIAVAPSTRYSLHRYEPGDVEHFIAQEVQRGGHDYLLSLGAEVWDAMATDPRCTAFTGMRDDTVLGFAGWTQFWPGRIEAWALLSHEVGRSDMMWIHRQARQALDEWVPRETRRIESNVVAHFQAGHKWMDMLGFTPEATLRRYDVNGDDVVHYAMIRENTNG